MLAKQKFQIRNQTLARSEQVLDVLQSMQSGGTAFDVRERLIEITGDRHSIAPVKVCLQHLSNLGLVICDETATGNWWSVRQIE